MEMTFAGLIGVVLVAIISNVVAYYKGIIENYNKMAQARTVERENKLDELLASHERLIREIESLRDGKIATDERIQGVEKLAESLTAAHRRLENGYLALLADSISRSCRYLNQTGWVKDIARRNIIDLYTKYEEFGGRDEFIRSIYRDMLNLPTEIEYQRQKGINVE